MSAIEPVGQAKRRAAPERSTGLRRRLARVEDDLEAARANARLRHAALEGIKAAGAYERKPSYLRERDGAREALREAGRVVAQLEARHEALLHAERLLAEVAARESALERQRGQLGAAALDVEGTRARLVALRGELELAGVVVEHRRQRLADEQAAPEPRPVAKARARRLLEAAVRRRDALRSECESLLGELLGAEELDSLREELAEAQRQAESAQRAAEGEVQ